MPANKDHSKDERKEYNRILMQLSRKNDAIDKLKLKEELAVIEETSLDNSDKRLSNLTHKLAALEWDEVMKNVYESFDKRLEKL